ncbi:hypothetical protein ABG067_008049, partial [Albugo candida]
MDDTARELTLSLVKAGAKDSLICNFLNDQGNNVVVKDIENFRQKIFKNDTADNAMLSLITRLEDEDYDVRFRSNIHDELESIFWIHQSAIDNVKRFPEVLVMDATYSTNKHKLPFINIVGTGNLVTHRHKE